MQIFFVLFWILIVGKSLYQFASVSLLFVVHVCFVLCFIVCWHLFSPVLYYIVCCFVYRTSPCSVAVCLQLMLARYARLWLISAGFILTLYGHITTTQQRTIIQKYGDWYTGCWWVGCYIWYSEEGPGWAEAPPSPLLAVPNVTAHPSTASVPTSYYSVWHYNCLCSVKG